MRGKDRKKKLKRISVSKPIKKKKNKNDSQTQLEIETLECGNKISIPKRGDKVTVKYKGQLIDGMCFDKSNHFQFKVGVGEVIKGWDQVVMQMSVGQVVKATIPSRLAYGSQGARPEIPPYATLIFHITLIKIN